MSAHTCNKQYTYIGTISEKQDGSCAVNYDPSLILNHKALGIIKAVSKNIRDYYHRHPAPVGCKHQEIMGKCYGNRRPDSHGQFICLSDASQPNTPVSQSSDSDTQTVVPNTNIQQNQQEASSTVINQESKLSNTETPQAVVAAPDNQNNVPQNNNNVVQNIEHHAVSADQEVKPAISTPVVEAPQSVAVVVAQEQKQTNNTNNANNANNNANNTNNATNNTNTNNVSTMQTERPQTKYQPSTNVSADADNKLPISTARAKSQERSNARNKTTTTVIRQKKSIADRAKTEPVRRSLSNTSMGHNTAATNTSVANRTSSNNSKVIRGLPASRVSVSSIPNTPKRAPIARPNSAPAKPIINSKAIQIKATGIPKKERSNQPDAEFIRDVRINDPIDLNNENLIQIELQIPDDLWLGTVPRSRRKHLITQPVRLVQHQQLKTFVFNLLQQVRLKHTDVWNNLDQGRREHELSKMFADIYKIATNKLHV